MNRDDFIIRKSDCRYPREQPHCKELGRNNLGINFELDRHYMKEHIAREQHRFDQKGLFKRRDPDSVDESKSSQTSCSLPIDDLLETNAVIDTNQPDKPLPERFFKFVSSYVNLHSSCRITNEMEFSRTVESVKHVNQTEAALTNLSGDGANRVGPRPRPKELGEGVLIATRDDVCVAATTGGEDVTVIREGSFVPKDRLPPPPKVPLNEEIVDIDICNRVCPEHRTTSCLCEINDNERLKPLPKRPVKESRYVSEEIDQIAAQQIVDNVANATNDLQTDAAFLGREELLSHVNLEAGQEQTRLVPPTECDPNLTLGICNGQSEPKRQLLNNTMSIGGLKAPLTEAKTILCVGEQETNRFLFQLDRRYNNVKSVKLISSTIPIYDTIINRHNNTILFQIQKETEEENTTIINENGDEIWEYQIPIGNYTVVQLAQIIEEDVNEALRQVVRGEDDIITIKVNELRNRFEIQSREPYTFNWEFVTKLDNCRSLYRMLGFSTPKQITFTDSFKNSDSFRLKLDDYVLVKIRQMDVLYDCITSDFYFNKIILRENGTLNPVSFDQHLDLEMVYDNSDGSFEFLDVSFVNQDGLPIDFQDCDFSMAIVIVEYADRLVGQNLNTRRGFIDYTSVTRNVIQKLN